MRFNPPQVEVEHSEDAAINKLREANAFGHAISALRKSIGITQKELASRSGLNKDHLCRLEKGVKLPSLQSIARIEMGLKAKLVISFKPIKKNR